MNDPALFLFAWPLRMRTEPMPQTSTEAFKSLDLNAECAKVLDFIRSRGWHGATADECEVALGHGHQRIADLRRKGAIVKGSATRATRAGRQAHVWIAR